MTPAQFKQARKSLGLNQHQIGALLNYGQQHISDIENGKTPIPQPVALSLWAILAFGMPSGWPR